MSKSLEIVQIMPAGGWMVELPNADGSRGAEPLVGWALLQGGQVVPLIEANGVALPMVDWSTKHIVFHPNDVPGGD